MAANDLFLSSLYLALIPLTIFSLVALKKLLLGGTHSPNSLPPSPPGLPLIGNLHQLSKLPHHSLWALAQKYGPDLMFLNLGRVPTLVVSSPDSLSEIVRDHDAVFSNRPKLTASDILFDGANNVAFTPYGEEWKQNRKLCVTELLSLKMVQCFQFVREEEVEALVGRIRKACRNGEAINLSQLMTEASNGILSRCVIGQSYMAEDGSINEAPELLAKVGIKLIAFFVGDFFPFLSWVDVLRGIVDKLRIYFGEIKASLNQVIQQHKAMKSNSANGSVVIDFLHNLLRLQEDGSIDFELTQDRIRAIIQDVLIAGLETSSTAMVWIMTELLRNSRVMKRVQDEVRRVVGKKGKVDMEDINQMGYLKCIVKETLRLHPPGPIIPRETTARVRIGGYEIPAKTRVLVNVWTIQRHPKFWENPEEFIPERFEDKQIDFNGQDSRLIPFGFGRRRCPGLAFGVASTEYLLANLLYWFDWNFSDDPGGAVEKQMDMTEDFKIGLHKKVPIHVVPIQFFP